MSKSDVHKVEIVVNGNTMLLEKQILVQELLQLLNIENQRFVVVINDEFLPKSMYGNTQLRQNDRCDVMSPISGG